MARFMRRPTRVRIKTAIGTNTRNMSVSCQQTQQAMTTHTSALSGSATTLPKSVLIPAPSISMSLVKRAINSCVPSSLKLFTSRWITFR